MTTTCGFCGGKGHVFGRAYDREGRAQVPPRLMCEYCNGEGCCDRGDELGAAQKPNTGPEHTADLACAGNPAWA